MPENPNCFDLLTEASQIKGKKVFQDPNKKNALNEYTAISSTGLTFPVLASSTPVEKNGKLIGRQGILIDITERRILEQQLQQAKKTDAISRFSGGIAHDFNNLLTGILGYAELSKLKGSKCPEIIMYLQGIIDTSLRAKDLISQISTLGRQRENIKEALNLNELINEIIDLLMTTLPDTIKIKTDIAHNLPPLSGDERTLHQLFMNLCINASNAMENNDQGVLSIAVTKTHITEGKIYNNKSYTGNYIKCTIADTGTGIEHSILEKIFDPYFSTKPIGKGSGLGLSVVQGVVEQHDGFIEIDSTLGKGTTFTIYLSLD